MEHTEGMRIYLPVTVTDLQAEAIAPRLAFAATTAVRELAPDEDDEGLEYLAFLAAADAAIDEGEITRIVLAADAPVRMTADTGIVEVGEIPWTDVVSIHIDDLDHPELLADINAAQAGDETARQRVNEADLLWYDAGERADVITLIAAI